MERLKLDPARALAVCVGAVLVAACGPTATAITTPTVAPPATVGGPLASVPPFSPPPAPSLSVPPDAAWQLLSSFPAGTAYEVMSTVVTPDGLVAAGYGPQPGEDYFGLRQGITWRSSDGLNWQMSADPELKYETPQTMVALGSDVYLLGDYTECSQLYDDNCTESPKAGNVIWRSSGGGAWQMLPQDPGMQAAFVDGLAAGHDRLIAYGSADDDAGTPTIWASSDGANWTSSTNLGGISQATAFEPTPGGFVMFGIPDDSSAADLAAATSSDGASFTAAQLPDVSSFPGAEIDGVAVGANGMAAVGYGNDDNGDLLGFALFSSDGTDWSLASDTDGSFQGSAVVEIEAVSNGYVAFGFTPDQNDAAIVGRAWFSPDGQSWHAAATTSASFDDLDSVGVIGNTAVMFSLIETDISDTNISSTIYPWYATLDQLAR